jgi:hypothetical protein
MSSNDRDSNKKPMFSDDDERRPLLTEDESLACMTQRPSS